MTPDQIRRSWDDDDTPRSVFPEPLAARLTRENKELRAENERLRTTVEPLASLLNESCVIWRCSACGWVADETTIDTALWHEANRTVTMICPECSAESAFVDHDIAVESVAALVHEAWMQAKGGQGITSRPSEWGEEQMVPFADLSERAKDLDRATVQAVFDALRAVLDKHAGEQTQPAPEGHAPGCDGHTHDGPCWTDEHPTRLRDALRAGEQAQGGEGS